MGTIALCSRHWRIQCVTAIVIIVTCLLAGCASGSAISGHPAPTLSSKNADTATDGQTGTATSGSQTKHRPRRPGSISSFLSSSRRTSDPCMSQSGITVAAGSSNTVFNVEELSLQGICLSGLDVSGSPSVILTTPNGVQKTAAVEKSVIKGMWYWWVYAGLGLEPFASVGKYSFRVLTSESNSSASTSPAPTTPSPSTTPSPTTTSLPTTSSPTTSSSFVSTGQQPSNSALVENIAASGSFTIIPATAPRAAVGNQFVAAGRQLQVYIAGFPANSDIYLTIYGPGIPAAAPGQVNYPLLLDLPGATANANGDALIQWKVPFGASVGKYAIWIIPQSSGCHERQACLTFSIGG